MSSPASRTVFGLPLYNAAEHLPEALDSLLAQTRRDFTVVMVDDSTDDAVEHVARRYAAADPRVHYERNDERLGLTRNWRRAFDRATEIAPEAELFAWASDHDWWHPRWLEVLAATMEARPDAAVAVCMNSRIIDGHVDWRSRPCQRPASLADTTGIASTQALMRMLRRDLPAGTAVYGLFRVDAVRRAGGFRHVLLADRLVLAEAALSGPIVGIDETLWFRRVTTPFNMERQRRACFPDGPPWYADLPWWIPHAAAIGWHHGVPGQGRRGISAAAAYAADCVVADGERRWRKTVKAASKTGPAARLKRVRAAVRHRRPRTTPVR
ncbi:MAG: glycosyltransferase family 2 protein [Solirubrobacteraceae bacterium]